MPPRHVWEEPSIDHPRGNDEDNESKEDAGRELAELLLVLHAEGQMSAKHVCLVSHFAAKAGAHGPVAKLAYKPNSPTGHYKRHLDSVAGLTGNL